MAVTVTDYVTTAQVKAVAPEIFTKASTTYDTLLGVLIGRASHLIDVETKRGPSAFNAPDSAAARWFTGEGGKYLSIDPCVAVTAVSIRQGSGTTETALESTDYVTWPYGAPDNEEPIIRLDIDDRQGNYATWPSGREAVKVTARWGFSDAPPEMVEQAVIAQVIYWFSRGQKFFTDVNIASGQFGAIKTAHAICPEMAAAIQRFKLRAL